MTRWVRALLVVLCLALAGPCWAQAVLTLEDTVADNVDASSFTLAATFGATASESGQENKRYIVVAWAARKNGTTNCTLNGTPTIGGVTATVLDSQATIGATLCSFTGIMQANVPTGTSGNVVMAFNGSQVGRIAIKVFRLTGVLATGHSTNNSGASAPTGTINVAKSGAAIGIAMTGASTSTTWTGLTEIADDVMESVTSYTTATLTPSTVQSGMTVTATFAAPGDSSGTWASWVPIGPVETSTTHYVTATGSASGVCDSGTPCTLTRAFALAGGMLMPPGSAVRIESGVYSQAAITVTGSGVSGFPIRFVGDAAASASGGVRLTGTRTSLPASSWTKTAGRTYVYEATADEAGAFGYTANLVAQRPPVSTWTSITVDDRSSPFTTSSGRVFSLNEPVSYTAYTTLANVDAVSCTFWHDTSANKIYVHMCHEGAPADVDNVYAGSSNWGSIDYTTGDFLTLESVSFEHMTGTGLHVGTGADDNVFDDIRLLSVRAQFEGHRTAVTDLVGKEYMQQGTPSANCYSAAKGNGSGADRECWNDNGDGYILLIGEQASVLTYNQTFDRVTLERGWNAFRIDGPNTLDHATTWGFANHAGQSSLSGVVVTNGIFLNAQDSWLTSVEDWNSHTYTHNIFYNGVKWACSNNHVATGTCPTSGWTMNSNLLPTLITDVLSEAQRVADCNVWIPRSAGTMMTIEYIGSGTNQTLADLTEVQSTTNDDDNSVQKATTAWTNGSIFVNFNGQQTYPIDFTLAADGAAALTTCGTVAGPDTLTGGSEPTTGGNVVRLRFKSPE